MGIPRLRRRIQVLHIVDGFPNDALVAIDVNSRCLDIFPDDSRRRLIQRRGACLDALLNAVELLEVLVEA